MSQLPHLDDTATVGRRWDIKIEQIERTRRERIESVIYLLGRYVAIDVTKHMHPTLVTMGKASNEIVERHVVQFAYECTVPQTAILHIVKKNARGRYGIDPNIVFTTSRAIANLVETTARNEELLKCATVEFVETIVLIDVLHNGSHKFAQVLFFAVAGDADRLGLSRTELS